MKKELYICIITLFALFISFIACVILNTWGLEMLLICSIVFFGWGMFCVGLFLNSKKKLDTSKIIIFILIYIGGIMAGLSYYLAYIGREEIAEGLSKAALIELVAPAVIMLIKSLAENLSINNNWPDKPIKKEISDDDPI